MSRADKMLIREKSRMFDKFRTVKYNLRILALVEIVTMKKTL
jgi:hypothetical protein